MAEPAASVVQLPAVSTATGVTATGVTATGVTATAVTSGSDPAIEASDSNTPVAVAASSHPEQALPAIPDATEGGPKTGQSTAQVSKPSATNVEIVEIRDDEFEPAPLFNAPGEVVLSQKSIDIAGAPHNVQLLLSDELFMLRAKSESVNIENLKWRHFLDLNLSFLPFKSDNDAVQMTIGMYTVTIYKAGAIELLGRFESSAVRIEVLEVVRKCAGRCGNHRLLAEEVKLKTDRVTATASLQRKLIITKLFGHVKKDESKYQSNINTGNHLEMTGIIDGNKLKVKISSQGKITIVASSRSIVKSVFDEILDAIQVSNAIQIVTSDQQRRASLDTKAVTHVRPEADQVQPAKALKISATDSQLPSLPTITMTMPTTGSSNNGSEDDSSSEDEELEEA